MKTMFIVVYIAGKIVSAEPIEYPMDICVEIAEDSYSMFCDTEQECMQTEIVCEEHVMVSEID